MLVESPPNDAGFEQLLREARAGSQEALGKLLNAFRRYLRALGYGEIRPELRPKVADSDLVQETYFDAVRGFAQFRGGSADELRAWLRTILFRNVTNFRRRYENHSKRAISREVSLDDGQFGGSIREQVTAMSPSPSAEVIRAEQTSRIDAATQTLPPTYREVVVLRNHQGRSFEVIGAEFGCSAEAARKLWERAIRAIAASLQR
jgi:RNA polymerase sigma-70 factor (ECF subfamily)